MKVETFHSISSRVGSIRPVALTDLDRNLLKRCLAEEPGAWKEFVDRFLGLFVHVIQHTAHARSVRTTPEDVDDLSAEIFLALLANNFAVLRHFRGKSSLAWYLAVVARRVVVREMSKRRMAEALGHVPASHSALDNAHVPPDSHRVESQEEVQRMLEQLPAVDAEAVKMFHIEGKSYREISAALGVAENTVGSMLSRARERLRHVSH